MNNGKDSYRLKSATAQLYTVRTATAEAVSHACSNASFNITVKAPEQPAEVTDEQYAAATEAIAAEQQFYVCTTSNGTAEGTKATTSQPTVT